MNVFWGSEAGAFSLFSPIHIAAIGVTVLVFIASIFVLNRKPEWRMNFRLGLALLIVLDEIALRFWWVSAGEWSAYRVLPFQLCGMLVWVSVALLLTKDYRLYEFVYFLGIGGASQAIITPEVAYTFPHFTFFQVFISHGAIVLAGLYMTFVEGYRPTWKSLPRVFGGLMAYAAFVGVVNVLLGTNFLFLASKPETASIMDALPVWPYYIPVLALIAAAVMLILYLPYAIKDLAAQQPITLFQADVVD